MRFVRQAKNEWRGIYRRARSHGGKTGRITERKRRPRRGER